MTPACVHAWFGVQISMGDKMFDNSSVTPLPGGWEHNMFLSHRSFLELRGADRGVGGSGLQQRVVLSCQRLAGSQVPLR